MSPTNAIPLKTDEQYRRMIVPYRETEKQQLSEKIAAGWQPVIRIWHNTILSDYPLYDYCCQQDISYTVENIYLSCNEAALAWICKDQLESRTLPDEIRWYLIGKRCLCEYILGAHAFAAKKRLNDARKHNFDSKYDPSISRTRDRIGNEYNISVSSVIKYESYSQAIDFLFDIDEELAKAILNGAIPTSRTSVVNLADQPPEMIKEQAERLLKHDPEVTQEPDLTKLVVRKRAKKKTVQLFEPNIAIKDMPVYDPDAEIITLSLTIPSWVSSMNRVRISSQLSCCSSSASLQLKDSLIKLISATSQLIASIKEDS